MAVERAHCKARNPGAKQRLDSSCFAAPRLLCTLLLTLGLSTQAKLSAMQRNDASAILPRWITLAYTCISNRKLCRSNCAYARVVVLRMEAA